MLDSRIEFSKLEQNLSKTYTARLQALCSELGQEGERLSIEGRAALDQLFTAEFEWLSRQNSDNQPSLYYRTLLLILRDLLKVSWQIRCGANYIELVAPQPGERKGLSREEQQSFKQAVREDLYAACQSQLALEATQHFVRSLENPSPLSRKKSVKLLLADGKELAQRLEGFAAVPEGEQLQFLQANIQPYLQLVEAEERDEFTGHKLGEIWRYFRLSWSIPNVPVPGRKLYYLVRDAAHPYHAVMAIAALSNSSLQVKDRDDYIGWTTESALKHLKNCLDKQDEAGLARLIELVETYVENGLAQIDPGGLVTAAELAEPTRATLERLKGQAQGFFEERQQRLKNSQGQAQTGAELPTLTTLFEDEALAEPELADEILRLDKKANERVLEARRQLVFKKRARAFYQLLFARHELRKLRKAGETLLMAVGRVIRKDSFRAALTYALYSNKGEKVGTNILDITTCGGIPPYSNLLSGKLMALLLLSPQVAADYRQRYATKHSLIASQMKGQEVLRDCSLVFLSTTSLYSVGSSQYNRLALPAGLFHPRQPRLEYKNRFSKQEIVQDSFLGLSEKPWQTSGYGTVHFSTETTEAVVQLGIQATGFREVNNVFGEGPSPKLRKIRNGLVTLGLNPDIFLKHNQPRLLYCAELYHEARPYLRGESSVLPEYLTEPGEVRQSTNKIAAYWQIRWLAHRLQHKPALEAVREFNPHHFTLQVEGDIAKRDKQTETPVPQQLHFLDNL